MPKVTKIIRGNTIFATSPVVCATLPRTREISVLHQGGGGGGGGGALLTTYAFFLLSLTLTPCNGIRKTEYIVQFRLTISGDFAPFHRTVLLDFGGFSPFLHSVIPPFLRFSIPAFRAVFRVIPPWNHS